MTKIVASVLLAAGICALPQSFAPAADESLGTKTLKALTRALSTTAGPSLEQSPRREKGNDTEALGREACLAAWSGDYDQTAKFLRQAIGSHPDDAGSRYDPWDLPLHDREALERGQRQLERMLHDRPQMRNNLDSCDLLWIWTAAKFGKKVSGAEIDWDGAPPSSGRTNAEHLPPCAGQHGQIRVRSSSARRGGSKAFEELWMAAVFELHNIENANEFTRIEWQAFDGTITQDQFVKAMLATEWKAAERTRRWYIEVFLPHAKRHKIPTDPLKWYCGLWGSADVNLAKYADRNAYPWQPYCGYFARLRISGVSDRLFQMVSPFFPGSAPLNPALKQAR